VLELKPYQKRGLETLEKFLGDTADLRNPSAAFQAIVPTVQYFGVPDLPGVPYVCLRVPTGGGKTLMASHSVGIAARSYVEQEHVICLWLVPSNAIREQTLEALQNRSHPYRQALDAHFRGQVRIMDMEEALYVQRSVLDGETVIIVSTLAAHRVGNTDLRKVYESSGVLQHHFTGLTENQLARLEKAPDGTLAYSLANVLRLRRPVVIMDEAHRARTSLSFDTLARFNPSCIVEFTATPETDNDPASGRFRSNVLYHVGVGELKEAAMVKLPIRLRTHVDWREVIGEAVAMANQLREEARAEERETGEYVRPIVLLQAQPEYQDRASVTVEQVKQCLLENCRIPEEEIAVATGRVRGIEGVDLKSRECRIRFIITVEALREGWDCPFAYILCTVSEVSSAGAVEQILGRVLRLPGAVFKKHAALNAAYAYSASTSFLETAAKLERGLVVAGGFDPYEARGQIVPQGEVPTLPGMAAVPSGLARFFVSEKPELSGLPEAIRQTVTFDEGSSEVVLLEPVPPAQVPVLKAFFPIPKDRKALEEALLRIEPRDPFRVPLLGVRMGQQLEIFDQECVLRESWNLAECDPTLTESEFAERQTSGEAGEIDVAQTTGHLRIRQYVEGEAQTVFADVEGGWTAEALAHFLARQRIRPRIPATQSSLYCRRVIASLVDRRGFKLDVLAHRRFQLSRAIERKIDSLEKEQNQRVWQALLFDPKQGIAEVDPSKLFLTFEESRYSPAVRYMGPWEPRKHYFPGRLADLNAEELLCAQHLDNHPAVKYWIRNLSRDLYAFRLLTSTDYFYPDFICLLEDERYLAVEYKGSHLSEGPDAKEKEMVGKLWAECSHAKCLFVMTNGLDFSAIDAAIASNDMSAIATGDVADLPMAADKKHSKS
jgi:type III restriction enzyme